MTKTKYKRVTKPYAFLDATGKRRWRAIVNDTERGHNVVYESYKRNDVVEWFKRIAD